MALNKEQILTLSLVKGIGPKKILAIGELADNISAETSGYEKLYDLMQHMKEKAIRKVTLSDLSTAYQKARKLIDESSEHGINFLGYYDENFPPSMRKALNEDGKSAPPLYLWYRGDISVLGIPGIAVIGTREPTPEGESAGTYLARQFAKRGLNIVSGLAVGCDTCGHKGALEVNGKTTAILADGLDKESIYPPENKELAEEIVRKGGLLLSEYGYGERVNRYSLVARDRLQAALANATLVVQTGIKGGTMHAANTTLVSQKPLYAILYKDEETNKNDKCLGNALLVEKGAKYIKGDDDLDKISETIKKPRQMKQSLFD
jgi:DNA processing protein